MRLVYERGEFDAESTDLVAEALFWFSLPPPVQRLQPAAHAHVLQPPAAVDADRAGRRHAGDQRRRVGRPLRAARDRRRRARHRRLERGDDGRPGVLPAPADRRARARHDAARRRARSSSPPRSSAASPTATWYVLDEALGDQPARADRLGRRRARRSERPSTPASCSPCGSPRRARSSTCSRAGCAARNLQTAVADQAHIRNFSIIAHIDHGKSTLADRILELTHTVDPRAMRAQLLDCMDLERERGITIKAQAVRVFYTARDGEHYQLHLIDTPGHVDFTYEVSRAASPRARARCWSSTRRQGVEAQTVANTYLAIDSGLELIPTMNKVDLPGAEPERVGEEIAELIGEPAGDVRRISAKTGEGVEDLLEELVAARPAAARRPRRAAARADLRLRVRPVPRRDRLHPRRRRHVQEGRDDPRDGDRHRGRDRRHRLLHARPDARRGAARRRGRLPDHRDQGRHAACASATR